jgi:lysozyme
MMKTSVEGLQFIMDQEDVVLPPYLDQAGYPTIGVGHLVKDGEDFPNQITRDQAMDLLAADVARFEAAVNGYGLDLTQNQFDVLVDFAFNAGEGALAQLLDHGLDEVPNQLPRWIYAHRNGERITVDDLVNRRAAEVEMWG